MTDDVAELDAAWASYHDRIKAAGDRITAEGFPTDPRMRAEGYRYIMRLRNLAHQIYVEFADPARPSLFRYGDDVSPFGATNTDNNYYRAVLDPNGTYRISGDVTGVKEILFSVQDGEFIYGKVTVTAEASLGELTIGDDGQLELILGGPERPNNWLALAADAEYINVREFVADWENDALASFYIERIDEIGPVENQSAAALIDALEKAATWVDTSVQVWRQFAVGTLGALPTNEIGEPRAAEGGAINMLHGACMWDLEPGQALLIELEIPAVTYWSIQTYVLDWLVPLDFTNRVTSLNDGQVRVDVDGKVRVVVSHSDPGVPNWLDTSGLRTGLLNARFVKAAATPTISTSVVSLEDLASHLPAGATTFSADDRRQQIAARRRGVARRFRR